ncbi:MAG: GGDEF domain-containing protein [Lachnospiraceae bacterium]|nr:GGDEF domain-containing protein [Lachnospiraceae bacterium]
MLKKLLSRFVKDDFLTIREFTRQQYIRNAKYEHIILRYMVGMEVFMLIYGYFNYNHKNPLMKVYMSLYLILGAASLFTDLMLSKAEKETNLFAKKRFALIGYSYFALITVWGLVITTYDVRQGGSYWVAATILMTVSVFLNLNPVYTILVILASGIYLICLTLSIQGGFNGSTLNIIVFIAVDIGIILKNYFTTYNNMYMEMKLKELSSRDALTGLNNRRALEERIENKEFGDIKSIALVDIDDFKQINDTGGHQSGDEALLLVATLFREYFGDKSLYRYGGDEFLILSEHDSAETTERLKKVNRRMSRVSKSEIPLHISGGIAVPEPMVAITDTIQMADAILYDAKRKGKGRIFASK